MAEHPRATPEQYMAGDDQPSADPEVEAGAQAAAASYRQVRRMVPDLAVLATYVPVTRELAGTEEQRQRLERAAGRGAMDGLTRELVAIEQEAQRA